MSKTTSQLSVLKVGLPIFVSLTSPQHAHPTIVLISTYNSFPNLAIELTENADQGPGYRAATAHPSTMAARTMPQTALRGISVRLSTLWKKLLKGTAPSRLKAHSMRALLVTDSDPAPIYPQLMRVIWCTVVSRILQMTCFITKVLTFQEVGCGKFNFKPNMLWNKWACHAFNGKYGGTSAWWNHICYQLLSSFMASYTGFILALVKIRRAI